MTIEIKSRVGGTVLWTGEATSLKTGVEVAVGVGADLWGADLVGADLRGADLRGSTLRGATLWGADLRGADLWGADLGGADLRGADFRGADLRNATLRGTTLGGANLWGATLWGADLGGADLGGGIALNAFLSIVSLDGWPVLIFSTSAGIRFQVGCHFFTADQAEAYWRGKPNRQGLYLLVTEGWKVLARMAGWEP